MVGFLGALLLTPVRNAAVLPAIILSGAALGAATGSYDISRRFTSLVLSLPAPGKERPGTLAFASGLSLSTTVLVIAAREALFAPPPTPPLVHPKTTSMLTQLYQGMLTMNHAVKHYPLRFRFVTAFVAGSTGGIVYPCCVAYINGKGGREGGEGERERESRHGGGEREGGGERAREEQQQEQ